MYSSWPMNLSGDQDPECLNVEVAVACVIKHGVLGNTLAIWYLLKPQFPSWISQPRLRVSPKILRMGDGDPQGLMSFDAMVWNHGMTRRSLHLDFATWDFKGHGTPNFASGTVDLFFFETTDVPHLFGTVYC